MFKKKYLILMILGFVFFFLSMQNFTFVFGITDTINDPENDVVKDFYHPGDYFDEIDITKLEVNDDILTLTVAGLLSDWEGYYYSEQKEAQIILIDNFDFDLYKKSGNISFPYYTITYTNWTSTIDFDVFFVKHLSETSKVYWTGSDYSSNENSAMSIGTGVDSSIEGNLSKTDYTITTNTTYFATTSCVTMTMVDEGVVIHFYFDFAPDEYLFNPFDTGDGKGIPGYELYIFLTTVLGISIFLIIKRIKRK